MATKKTETPDYGVMEYEGHTFKLIRDPAKLVKTRHVLSIADPRNKFNENELGYAVILAMLEKLFSAEDLEIIDEFDFIDFCDELAEQHLSGLEVGN